MYWVEVPSQSLPSETHFSADTLFFLFLFFPSQMKETNKSFGCDPWRDFLSDCEQKGSIDLSKRHCYSVPSIIVHFLLTRGNKYCLDTMNAVLFTFWRRSGLPFTHGRVTNVSSRWWGRVVLPKLCQKYNVLNEISALFWNRCFQSVLK